MTTSSPMSATMISVSVRLLILLAWRKLGAIGPRICGLQIPNSNPGLLGGASVQGFYTDDLHIRLLNPLTGRFSNIVECHLKESGPVRGPIEIFVFEHRAVLSTVETATLPILLSPTDHRRSFVSSQFEEISQQVQTQKGDSDHKIATQQYDSDEQLYEQQQTAKG